MFVATYTVVAYLHNNTTDCCIICDDFTNETKFTRSIIEDEEKKKVTLHHYNKTP